MNVKHGACPLVKNANIGIGLKSNSIKTVVFTFISMKFTRNIVYSKGGSHFYIANTIRSKQQNENHVGGNPSNFLEEREHLESEIILNKKWH